MWKASLLRTVLIICFNFRDWRLQILNPPGLSARRATSRRACFSAPAANTLDTAPSAAKSRTGRITRKHARNYRSKDPKTETRRPLISVKATTGTKTVMTDCKVAVSWNWLACPVLLFSIAVNRLSVWEQRGPKCKKIINTNCCDKISNSDFVQFSKLRKIRLYVVKDWEIFFPLLKLLLRSTSLFVVFLVQVYVHRRCECRSTHVNVVVGWIGRYLCEWVVVSAKK